MQILTFVIIMLILTVSRRYEWFYNLIFFLALVDTRSHFSDDLPIDIFAIGFEEIVDLNASNIMAAR